MWAICPSPKALIHLKYYGTKETLLKLFLGLHGEKFIFLSNEADKYSNHPIQPQTLRVFAKRSVVISASNDATLRNSYHEYHYTALSTGKRD